MSVTVDLVPMQEHVKTELQVSGVLVHQDITECSARQVEIILVF